MRDEEWIETLEDGRRVKFTNQELDDWAFVTAEVEGNKVVSSIVLTEATKPLRGGKSWCERGDSNPHGFTRQILSLVRLPIPPLSHV